MFNIKTLNKISASGLANFDAEQYICGDDMENPDAIIVRSASMHEMEMPDSLLAIARAGAGVNNIPVDDCAEQGIVVFNTPGANANAVKELTVCGLLLASRRIVPATEWIKELKGSGDEVSKKVEKGKSNFVGPEISGKTLGVVGLGAIGRLVAAAAASLGMKVIGYDVFLPENLENVELTSDLDKIFVESDYITLHCPSLPTTKNMINADSIAKCKDAVRILNFARGDLVNTADLISAVDSGKVAAYVTDFPADDMLCHDGIIAIPHLGASTPESEENCAVMAVKQLADYLENGNIKNSVNFPNVCLPVTENARVCVLSDEDVADKIEAILGNVTAKVSVFKKKAAAIFEVAEFDESKIEAIANIPGIIAIRVIE